MPRSLPVFLAGIFLVASLGLGTRGAARADTPTVLVSSGVGDYSLAPPKVFWHTPAYCPPEPPKSPIGPDDEIGGGGAASDPEVISRTASRGSPARKIFELNPNRPAGECNPYHFLSDIIADEDYVYWIDTTGLVRLSVEANPGDPVEILNATIQGDEDLPRPELDQDAGNLYVMYYEAANDGDILRIKKSDGARSTVWHLALPYSKLSTDGKYVYYIRNDNRLLYRVNLSGPPSAVGISFGGGVTGYFAEGVRIIRGGSTEYVFIAKGDEIYRYDNVTGDITADPIYTSTDPDALIYSLVTDASKLFFIEARIFFPCADCFGSYNTLLFRRSRGTTGAAELIYNRMPSFPTILDADKLTTDGTFLFWKDESRVLRLPNDADELPKTNMRVTAVEVTQAIQDQQNNVILIEGKRAFARVFVKSDGPAVSGVTAYVYGQWTGGGEGPVTPHYTGGGSYITIYPSPDTDVLEESFIFELPVSWTTKSNLRVRAELNPYKVPIQTSYANNSMTVGPLDFAPSPRLEVQFIAWEYEWNGTNYEPRYFEDILATYAWVRRAYPVASKPGDGDDPAPGFRPRLQYIFDEDLGVRVDMTADECLVYLQNSDPDDDEENGLCAANYSNSKLKAMQAEAGEPLFYYGMISDGHKFPRGRASGNVCTGPTGSSTWGWDNDGTYSDWYAGHEIGHTLGRGHPIKAADDPSTKSTTEGCGHDSGDPNFPYNGARIGPAGGTLEGFDVGGGNVLPALYPRDTWTDMMSYCDFQWISDYTYQAIYDFLMAGQGGATDLVGGGGGGVGDWLSVFGVIQPSADKAFIHHLRRLGDVARVPPRRPGPFTLVLLGGGGAQLANYPFTAEMPEDSTPSSPLSFGLVVPFVAGARELRIVETASGQVFATRSISANAPVISNVALQNPPNPVSGVVTLGWTASDPDGDTLCYDVHYAANGGAFAPLGLNVKLKSLAIDSSRLAGGTGRFLVYASDGVLTAFAQSPVYTVAKKNPVPRILTPAKGTQAHWGTLIQFVGEARDVQDGSVAESSLQWTIGRRVLGTGSVVTADDLRVGANVISLRAVNSQGLAASTSVTVIIDDDLSLPGPTLAAGPSQIGWHVGEGASQPVTAQIGITNSGSGSLSWTASEGAAWLSLSAIDGTAPALVTATANPAGLASGTTLTAEIVIDGPGDQAVTIPVTLSVGNPFDGTIEPPASGFRRGDSNADAEVNISDAINTLGYLFGGTGVVNCLDAADANDNGKTDISDAVAVLGFLFLGSAVLPAPGPSVCGPDPTDDAQPVCEYDPVDC